MGPVAGPRSTRTARAAFARRWPTARGCAGDECVSRSRVPAGGYFVRPTVLTDVTPDMPAFRDEIFGPVLAVCEFESVDEAIALGNRSSTGCRPPSSRQVRHGPGVHRRHRGRPRARQRPHRLQGALAAVWRRQAVGGGPAGEQRDRTGILRRPESRLRARLRPRPSVVLFRHEYVSAFLTADVRHQRLGRLSDDTRPPVAAFRTRCRSETMLHDV